MKELKGFLRISLRAGEAKHILFEVDTRQLAFLNRNMEYVVELGALDVMIGASSQDIRMTAMVELTGSKHFVAQKAFSSRVVVMD